MRIVLMALSVLGLLTLAAVLDFLAIYAARSFVRGRHMHDWRELLFYAWVIELVVLMFGLMPAYILTATLWLVIRVPAVIYFLVKYDEARSQNDPNRPAPPTPGQVLKDMVRELTSVSARLFARLRKALPWFRFHAATHIRAL